MKNNISVLTCTGDRPICFRLLERWMKQQTVKPSQWIVIDDGKIPTEPTMDCTYVRREPKADDPKQTLNVNMKTALPLVDGEKLIIWEDDEYYAPQYIEIMSEKLNKSSVVGICKSKYYYLPTYHYYVHPNIDHASLAQTAMRDSFFYNLEQAIQDDPFMDLRIWRKAIEENNALLFHDGNERCLYVGFKGLAGRRGIGSGHRGIGTSDPQQRILKQWIPNDYTFYMDGSVANKTTIVRR